MRFRRFPVVVAVLLCCFSASTLFAATQPPRPQLQVESYAIAVDLDPATHHLNALARLTCIALGDQTIAVFELHNDLRPTEITDGAGHLLTAERNTQDNTIRLTLPATWTRGTQQIFNFKYEGVLESADNSPVDGLKLAYVGDPISYLLYAGRWFPMVGYSTSRFAAAITVRVPKEFTVVGSGAQGGARDIGGGKAEYSFLWNTLSFPGTIVAGRFGPPVTSDNVKVYTTAPHAADARDYAETGAKEYAYYSSLFGPAATPVMNIVELPEDTVPATWGPEVAAIRGSRIAEKNSYRLLANTVSHQWWGVTVAPLTLNDAWITNGMAHYSEVLYTAQEGGKPALADALREMSAGALAYDTAPLSTVGRLDPFSPDFQSLTLDKGGMVFHMLRWEMGDANFFAAMKKLVAQYNGKQVRTADVQKVCEQVSGLNLEPFFAQWLDGTGAPEFSDKYTVYRLGNGRGFRTVGEIDQDLDLFRMPVDVRIETDGRTEDKRIDVVGTVSPYQEDTFGRPRRILIDPDNWVLKNSPDMRIRVAILRGQQLVGQNDMTGALTEYQKALDINPNSSLAAYRIAEVYTAQRNYQSAANSYRDALRGDDDPRWTEVWSHIQLGKIFDATGQRDRALNEYRQALQTNDNTQGALSVARAYIGTPYKPPQRAE